MDSEMELYPAIARVLVDRLGGRQFDYLIPEELAGTIRVGARVRVPFGGRKALGTVTEILEASDLPRERLKPLEAAVSKLPELGPPLMRLAGWIASYYICSRDAALRVMLPQPVRKGEISHSKQRMARLAREPSPEEEARLSKRAPRQAAALGVLRAGGGTMPAADLGRKSALSAAGLAALAKAGLVEIFEEVRERDPHAGETIMPTRPLELNAEQRAALDVILAPPGPDGARKPVLLYGVTGSGKTEVYLQALAAVLREGRGGIVLVPEIALTPQTVDRFRARFAAEGVGVAVLHSHLSGGERHDEWHRIRRGGARVVIGARSAVFAPLENPGLIIVDEEHEHSYKQEEAPHYNARDLAVVRGRIEGAAVVLGSATPSFESYHNALTGKYALARLTKRVDDQQMPLIRVIDMRMERFRQKGAVALSEKLIAAIQKRLDRKEQVILFLNRRGYASSLVCPACGAVIGCPHCSVALTWHRSAGRMSCHFCGYAEVAPRECPSCGKPGLRDVGTGTERVEESLGRFFPGAVIRRMDADTMTRKGAYRETLDAFRTGKIDILVGTQMIAKGLHFPNVTLVGIVNADLGLHLPDFRAGERTFQLLTQVAGRAGRGDMAGEVLVQTFSPANPSVQFSRRHDFEGFYEAEAEFRKKFFYPPFCHLILITLRSKKAELVRLTGSTLSKAIRAADLPPDTEGGEAVPAPIERLAGETRVQIILRSKSVVRLSKSVSAALEKFAMPDGVRISVDVDAHDLL